VIIFGAQFTILFTLVAKVVYVGARVHIPKGNQNVYECAGYKVHKGYNDERVL